MALPEREMRACTITCEARESVISFDMALLSSSVNFSGSSLAWRFSSHRMVADYARLAYVPAAGGLSSDMSMR